MLKKFMVLIMIISPIYAQGVITNGLDTIAEICNNEERLDVQLKCTQKMIKCLNMEEIVKNFTQKQVSRCIMQLKPEDFKTE